MPRPAAKAARTVYACGECGHSSPKWLGQCRRAWGTRLVAQAAVSAFRTAP